MNGMNLIINTVMQEKQRIDYMIEKYSEVLRALPKGSLLERRVGAKRYYYLKYREGGKVISKYISVGQVDEIRDGIERRRHTEKMLVSLQKERELANRILGGKA